MNSAFSAPPVFKKFVLLANALRATAGLCPLSTVLYRPASVFRTLAAFTLALPSLASAQLIPDTFQRLTSTASPGVSYDIGVAGTDGSFSIVKAGAGQRLTIDASGNVTVLNNLTVNGTFSAANFAGGAVTGGATGLTLNAGGTNQNITLTPSGSGRTIINGNVGVGTTSPGTNLAIGSSATGGSGLGILLNRGATTNFLEVSDNTKTFISGVDNTQTFGKVGMLSAHDLAIVTSNNAKIYLQNSSGNVGIGTSTPTAKLDVAGTAKVSGDTTIGGTLGIGLGGSAPGATLDVGTDIRVRRDLYVDGVIHVASGNVQAATTTDAINITSTTDSSGYATGALIVSGGAGIAKNLSVGQNITAVGNITTAAGTVNAAAVQVAGQNVWHAGNFNPANYVQQSGGVVSGNLGLTGALNGGASGLTINAGATNQSLVLDSDGTGRVEVRDTLAVTNTTGSQYLLMGNQDATGANNPAILRVTDGKFEFGRGSSWTGQGGTFTSRVSILSNGNVGIGTASPTAKIHVLATDNQAIFDRTGSTQYSEFIFSTAGTRNWTLGTRPNNAGLHFNYGTTGVNNALYLGTTGLVGIGTTNPQTNLEVAGNLAATGALGFVQLWADSSIIWKTAGTQGGLRFGNATNLAASGYVERMRITDAGNVGIGTASPTAKLDVAGNGRVGGTLTVTSQTTTDSLAVTTNTTIGGYAVVAGQTTTGNLVTGTSASVGTNLSVGGTLGVTGASTFNGTVGIGTTLPPFTKLQVNGGSIGVTAGGGGFVHLADDLYADGTFGVRLAGINNGSNGHDLVVQTRTTAGGAFQPSFTVKSDGTAGLWGSLKFFSATGGEQWGFNNTGGVLSLFRASPTGGGATPVTTFYPDSSVAFAGRISMAAPAADTDGATKGYVDDHNPWNWDLGDVTLKDPSDWLGLGVAEPSAPFHVQASALFGEVARFGTGGPFWNLNLRSYLTLQSQNPSYWWEFSAQDETGGGAQNGFALRAKHADEGVSKERLYISPGLPVPAAQRSFMRLYNQNPASGWEFSVEDAGGGGAGNGLALREYTQSVTSGPALYIAENTGHVGLGTTVPGAYRLAVNGSVRAREVVVENTGWADYVFADDYPLAPLSEVEAHIRDKKHLPGIPSAREVADRGVNLGEMQATLLSKVEELTLHLIAQEKAIQALQRENVELRKQMEGRQ